MTTGRRNFLKTAAFFAAGSLLAGSSCSQNSNNSGGSPKKSSKLPKTKLKLSFRPYELQMKHRFTVAANSRTTTPVVLTEIEYDGITGYGEASMPPYLGESHESVQKFLAQVDLEQFNDPFRLEHILDYVDSVAPENRAAKASIDIALHDLTGKIMKQPWYKIWGFDAHNTPNTSYTIGIDKPSVVEEKTREAGGFKILKVKLGGGNDREMIESVRRITDVPLCVDVNQGWTDKHRALEMIHYLKEQGVVFVEQPMPKTQTDDMAWLTQNSPIPTIADEALQRMPDVEKAYGVYSGINVKLMKCTGMREAHKMLTLAKALKMKTMIGCMVETSCAVTAAAQLSTMVNWADLDGNLLISNDVFDGLKIKNGKVTLPQRPGIGIKKIE